RNFQEEFPDDTLAQYGLQKVGNFVWNSSCSEIFFQCSFRETYLLKCQSPKQAFDKNITNCNFKRNMPECPEYDHVLHCAIAKHCSENEFACCAMPQRCIPIRRRCDGHIDCADGGDENNCPIAKHCSENEFACCAMPQRCIPIRRRCDGHIDCADGGDENNCPCVGKFVCESDLSKTIMGALNCIDPLLYCNGVKDCPNGEDEINCNRGETQHFLCENQKESIMLRQWCDGQQHCSDGSDEKYCK
uniref:Chitin-binding type-2 domain-containing protein n=1 Tax=Ascaris lumbricoides TaxID=6252 RepID=A0A9J2PXH6_ASCLU